MQTSPLRVTVLNWRDTTHPEGGGSERYIERIAADLVADGCEVEIFCSRHPGVPAEIRRDGITFRHGGGRWTVYFRALSRLLTERLRGRGADVVIDVHNGVPFFARTVAGCPVVVLVHHVHREQWHVVFGKALASVGWWLESRLSPRFHRGCQYVAVSEVTRRELTELGVDDKAIAIVHNGTRPVTEEGPARDPEPSLVVLGRLVPHKRVEHALEAVARLSDQWPGLRLRVIGEGWWRSELEAEARRLGVADRVTFTGFVDEGAKEEMLARSWLMLAPSVKEGWGLMVVEAAAHGVPAIAYRSAGGLAESIHDGVTGLLVEDDLDTFIEATRRVLADQQYREALGDAARDHVSHYSWRTAPTSMHLLLRRIAGGLPPTSVIDPTAAPDQKQTDGVRLERAEDGGVVVDLRGDSTEQNHAPAAAADDVEDEAESSGSRQH
jgi:glycosyltransferase involved in cell wall biosynthesis